MYIEKLEWDEAEKRKLLRTKKGVKIEDSHDGLKKRGKIEVNI